MVKIIAEIGINHNGDIDICKKLMFISKAADFDYVKIQKRSPDHCVPEEQKKKRKQTPWGEMSYLEYKHKIEFNESQIQELYRYAKEIDIELFASVWDIPSCRLMAKYTTIGKIGSALITNIELCKLARKLFKTLIISCGMSTESEIENCVTACDPDVIMHSNSTYPCPVQDLNLNYIKWLQKKYPHKVVGYSGHEFGCVTTYAAAAMGAKFIERHVTLDRNLFGSDQKSSVMPVGIFKLAKGIRAIEQATKYKPQKRILFEGELKKRKSLRKTKY